MFSSPRPTRLLTILFSLMFLFLGCAAASPSTGVGTPGSADSRPNIVFITTDDQRVEDLRWMPHTRRLLGGQGIKFTDALSPHPLCCPARAEWITGQYGHNNGVHHNDGVHGGYPALRDPGNNIAAWLAASGYQTAMAGKFLNGYKHPTHSEAGWTHWNPSVRGVYTYTRTKFYNDGNYTDRTGENVDDVVAGYAQDYIREFSGTDRPFFVWASHLSPHNATVPGVGWTPPLPAARHAALFADSKNTAERKRSFARAIVDGVDKSAPRREMARLNHQHLARIRSLQAVDEGVRDIVATLAATGELDNTYIIFTSDNGFLLGEHNLTGKNFIYREALAVPFLVRVPGQTTAEKTQTPVTLVDIAPTIADLAQARPGRTLDGVSFAPLLRGQAQPWRDTQLVQTGRISHSVTDPGWQVRGVRTGRWTYGLDLRTGVEQLYDRRNDRREMVNLARRDAYAQVRTELRSRLKRLAHCTGTRCARSFGPVR